MEAPKNEIQFLHEFLGRNGRARVTIRAGEQEFTDEFKVTGADARERFAAKACERFGALDEQIVLAELGRIVKDYASYCERLKAEEREQAKEDEAEREQEESSDVETLVSIAEDSKHATLFRTPEQHDAQAFVVLRIGKTWQTWPVKSKAMRQWLLKRFRARLKRFPSRHALDEAIFDIEAITVLGDVVGEVHLRVAEHQGAIYIDLGDDTWRAVRVTSAGWEIVESENVPVHFLRRSGMKALPVPERGGSLDELFDYVNVPEGEPRCLLLCCLVAYLRPHGPYPILIVNGEQGSAKSTLCRRVRDLVDPSQVALRGFPRDVRDLMISAKNGWIQGYDNISYVAPSMSDALCSLATGGGFGTRQLYTDDEEALFCFIRPIMLNGIPDLATRPDLLDRAIVLYLPTIPEDRRLDEETLNARFRAAYPRILGALYDVLSKALARYPHVRLSCVPRMADFAKFAMAAAEALGYTEDYFLDAYRANRGEQVDVAIDSSPVALGVIELIRESPTWEGSATQLLAVLSAKRAAATQERAPRSWPTSPSSLSNELRRLAPLLRARGLVVETGLRRSGGGRERYLTITLVGERLSQATPPACEPSSEAFTWGADARSDNVLRCHMCGGSRHWRLRSNTQWVCGRCHAPIVGAENVEWNEPDDDTGKATRDA